MGYPQIKYPMSKNPVAVSFPDKDGPGTPTSAERGEREVRGGGMSLPPTGPKRGFDVPVELTSWWTPEIRSSVGGITGQWFWAQGVPRVGEGLSGGLMEDSGLTGLMLGSGLGLRAAGDTYTDTEGGVE